MGAPGSIFMREIAQLVHDVLPEHDDQAEMAPHRLATVVTGIGAYFEWLAK